MENNRKSSTDPLDKSRNYNISEEGITNDQIEKYEVAEGNFDKERNERAAGADVSQSNIDTSQDHRGNIGVQKSNLTPEEKLRYDREAEDIKGGGDIGEGRGSGSDRA